MYCASFGFWAGASLALGLAICLTLAGLFLAAAMNRIGLFTLGDFFARRYTRPVEVGASALMIFAFTILLGGNLDMIATAAGWTLPGLQGAILLIEDVEKGLGHVDRNLTRLLKSGALAGVAGVAVGQFTGFASSKGVTVVELLRERLAHLAVPILGGLPFGHGDNPVAVPVGTQAVLDASGGTLTVAAAMR